MTTEDDNTYFKIYYDEYENLLTDILYVGRLKKLSLLDLEKIKNKLLYALEEVNETIYSRNS